MRGGDCHAPSRPTSPQRCGSAKARVGAMPSPKPCISAKARSPIGANAASTIRHCRTAGSRRRASRTRHACRRTHLISHLVGAHHRSVPRSGGAATEGHPRARGLGRVLAPRGWSTSKAAHRVSCTATRLLSQARAAARPRAVVLPSNQSSQWRSLPAAGRSGVAAARWHCCSAKPIHRAASGGNREPRIALRLAPSRTPLLR